MQRTEHRSPALHYCHNHPQVKTRRRCFQCGKYICRECEKLFLQRSFCSWTCLRRALLRATTTLIKLPAETSGFSRKFHAHIRDHGVQYFTLVFIAAVLAAPALLIVLQDRRTHEGTPALTTADTVTAALVNAQAEANTVRISGEAADSIIIAVRVNGRITAVGTAQDGKFLFENIRLDQGDNEIQVFALTTDGRTQILQQMTARYGAPVPAFLARSVARGDVHKRRIALTFDGGSGAARAEEILDLLKGLDLRCTMFLTGGFIRRYPQLVIRMAQDGHEIGNHTWSHPHLTSYAQTRTHETLPSVTREFLQSELTKTAALLERVTGKKPAPLWRAPFGEHNEEIRRWAAELGYLHIGWTTEGGETMDTLDWVTDSTAAAYHTGGQILRRLLDFGRQDGSGANGGIILMHLDSQRPEPVFQILPALIDSMRNRGYTFATISEMIRH